VALTAAAPPPIQTLLEEAVSTTNRVAPDSYTFQKRCAESLSVISAKEMFH